MRRYRYQKFAEDVLAYYETAAENMGYWIGSRPNYKKYRLPEAEALEIIDFTREFFNFKQDEQNR